MLKENAASSGFLYKQPTFPTLDSNEITVEHFVFYRFVKNNASDNLFTYIFIEESCTMGSTVVLFLRFNLIARQPCANIQLYEPFESFLKKILCVLSNWINSTALGL